MAAFNYKTFGISGIYDDEVGMPNSKPRSNNKMNGNVTPDDLYLIDELFEVQLMSEDGELIIKE
jgi:hypothetical protein